MEFIVTLVISLLIVIISIGCSTFLAINDIANWAVPMLSAFAMIIAIFVFAESHKENKS